MKVVVVTDSLSRAAGGLFESVRRLAQEMHQIGFKVQVFGVGDKWVNEDLQKWRPLEPRVFPCRGPQSFGYAPGLVEAIKAERPISMQIHGIWQYASIAVLRASTAMGCPYVVNLHGMLDPWAVRNSRWKKCLAAWAYERRHLQGAACLRALCRSEVNAIRAYGLRNPVCIVPNAIDLPQETSANRSLQSPFPADRRVLLYLGRIHPKKNLLNLLEAWSLVQKSRVGGQRSDEWLLAIAGWDQGGYERQLKRRAAELEIGCRVAFLGPRLHIQ